MRSIVKFFYLFVGVIALILGVAAVALPLVPTTPLLLLAAFCFVRGSDRFDRWFKGTSIYKKYVESFMKDMAMTLRQKLTLCLFADAMIITAMVLANHWAVWVVLIAIIIYKYYFFFTKIKTIP